MTKIAQTILVRDSKTLFCVLTEDMEVFGPFQTWEEAEDYADGADIQFIIKEITTPATVEVL